MTTLDIRHVPPEQARQVLRLTLALPGQSAADIEGQVSSFINHARAIPLDLSGQWLASEGGRVVAACSCIESPGRSGILFLPAYGLAGGSEDGLASLLADVIGYLTKRKVRLAQSLLMVDDRHNERLLLRAGFRPIAELIYMEMAVCDHTPVKAEETAELTWQTYNSASHREFAELIEATYQGSLDCPALSGVRNIEEIMAGHKAVGLFDPSRWRLAQVVGRAAGCILLGENPLQRVLDVAYMGVHPEARGRGLGRALVREAGKIAYREQFEKVTLAVDAGNVPARRLYGSAGFVETMRRRALIRSLDSSAAES